MSLILLLTLCKYTPLIKHFVWIVTGLHLEYPSDCDWLKSASIEMHWPLVRYVVNKRRSICLSLFISRPRPLTQAVLCGKKHHWWRLIKIFLQFYKPLFHLKCIFVGVESCKPIWKLITLWDEILYTCLVFMIMHGWCMTSF